MQLLPPPPFIAHHPRHLTTAWAQYVATQHTPGTIVKQVKLSSVDVGTTTRICILVDHNGPETLPRQWFIKTPSLSWRARAITALPRLLHTEIRFYNELAQITPITKPTVLSAKSYFGRGSTLVLNDITAQGAIPGSPSDTLSVAQAVLVIEKIASLHAQFWNKTHTKPEFRWLAGPVRRLEDHLGSILAVPLMKRGLDKAGHLVPKALHAPAIHYARNRRLAMRFLSQGPQTIIHHDCHPGNIFWLNNKPGLLDWQMVRIGEGISDIAYFMATSLAPEIRKTNEAQLIKHYIQSLTDNGVSSIDFEQIKHRYSAHLVYPFEAMLITLAVGGMMDLDTNLELIKRAASAINDNDSFAALPV
ncbi:MAG: ecdysteroid 22-kinase family protein [Methylococcaceae bacterium]|nr:ecdysteroid 22-kinase family protein [Methylococcaceae bacterium]